MRVLILVIIVILLAAGAFFLLRDKKPDTGIVEDWTKQDLIEHLKSATILVPDSTEFVTLENGEAMFDVAPGAGAQGIVTLVDNVSAEWEGEGRKDLAAVLAVNSGGTGTFYYLVLFDVARGGFTQKSSAFLGDRIEVTHVGIGELVHDPAADYRVTVETLVRGEDEPLAAAPTIPEARVFYVTKQLLEEVEVGGDDT